MLYRRLGLLAAIALLCLPAARAQETNWIPQGMDALADHASFHTEFTLDKSMLDAAGQIMPDADQPVIAKLRSITVDSFRFPGAGLYDPAELDAVRSQYHGHGWTHLVPKHAHAAAAAPPDPQAIPDPDAVTPTQTDLWVLVKHAKVEGMVLLVANQRNVNLVAVDGMISPIDLLHLRGHFGIPRFDGDDFQKQK